MVEWNFPINQNGQIKGIADAGIENFNGTELNSLVRENCQNSLDAATNETSNVIVEFERYHIETNKLPGINQYRGILEKCRDFWHKSKSEKTKSFLNETIDKLNKSKSFVLRISDYNTIGLCDPYTCNSSDDFSFDGWNALIKIDGGASKDGDKAGAFGIGKSAPFSNSYYRVVFYRTHNQKGEIASQGVSRLVSYKEGRYLTSGIGYFGDPNGNNPIKYIKEIESLNKRDKIGTDVFIYGFKSDENWKDEIIISALDNFLVSIYNKQLSVKVQESEINSHTLEAYINRMYKLYGSKMKDVYGNYLCLSRITDVKKFNTEFHGMGTLNLKILVSDNEKLDRKILVVRKAGMKLFRLGGISKFVNFTGILELEGELLNKYFRSMESVAHDKWEPGRHKNPKEAKKYYDEIKEWIKTTVARLVEYDSNTEINVKGLSEALQHECDAGDIGGPNDKCETLNDCHDNIDIIERPIKAISKGFIYGNGDYDTDEYEKTTGSLGPIGEPGIRLLKGSRKRKTRDKHIGIADIDGKDIVLEKKGRGTACPLTYVRIIKRKSRVYSVNIKIPHNVEYGKIELVAVGENGKSNKIMVEKVKCLHGCRAIETKGSYIEAFDMTSSSIINIIVELVDSRDYAMEVNVYEHH